MRKVTVFETIYEHAVGIDIGAEKIFVSVYGRRVVSFSTFTSDCYRRAEYLRQKGTRCVSWGCKYGLPCQKESSSSR